MIGETLDSKYEIIRLLGKGGMGAVYEAKHTGTGRRVAVKVIIGDFLKKGSAAIGRFEREARAAGSIDSAHIAQVLDAGTDADTGAPYLVMEYLKGEDLHHLLKRIGPLPPEIALRVVGQACVGLARAHDARVMHRDIKPANLFLAQRDEGEITVKLLDFGIAKIKPEEGTTEETAGLTRTGGMVGSPLYMSPEQARGIKDIDYRTDLWSLGVVLYRALTGRAPHEDVDAFGDLIIAICSVAPRPVQEVAPWVSPEVAAVVHGALRIDPKNRFQTATAMLDAIKAVLPGGFNLRVEQLVGISEHERATIAPKFAYSITEAGITGRFGATGVPGRSMPPPSGSVDTAGHTNDGMTPPLSTQEAPRARSRLPLVAGAALVIAIGAFGVMRAVSPGAPPASSTPLAAHEPGLDTKGAQAANVPTAPSPASASRRFKLVILPSDASVEIDGKSVPVKDGVVEIDGLLGSTHQVRVFKGKTEGGGEVIISENGAIPPKLELGAPRSPSSAAVAGGHAPAAPPGTTPSSKPSAKPKSDPLVPDSFQ